MRKFVYALVHELYQVPCPRGPFTRGFIELDAEWVAEEYDKLPGDAQKELASFRDRFSELMARQAKLHDKAQKLVAEVEALFPPEDEETGESAPPDVEGDEDEGADESLDGLSTDELSEMVSVSREVMDELTRELDRRRGSTEESEKS